MNELVTVLVEPGVVAPPVAAPAMNDEVTVIVTPPAVPSVPPAAAFTGHAEMAQAMSLKMLGAEIVADRVRLVPVATPTSQAVAAWRSPESPTAGS